MIFGVPEKMILSGVTVVLSFCFINPLHFTRGILYSMSHLFVFTVSLCDFYFISTRRHRGHREIKISITNKTGNSLSLTLK